MDNQETARQLKQDSETFKSASSVLLAIMILIPHAARLMGVALPRDVRPISTRPSERQGSELQLGSNILIWVEPDSIEITASYNVGMEFSGQAIGIPRNVSSVTEIAQVAIQLLWVILNDRCPNPDNVLALAGYTERVVLEAA